MKTLLVGNPTAQSGKNAERIDKARKLLDQSGLSHDFLPTAPAGKTVDAVRDELLAGTYETVIAMGGDGTFAEVAKGLLSSKRDVRLAMLPTGTANDQGKSFGLSSLPAALPHNVAVIAQGNETRLDAGRIVALDEGGKVLREDWFFDSAGWGISPRVLATRNEDRAQISKIPIVREIFRDHVVYAGALFRTFLSSYVEDQKFDAELTVDGQAIRWANLTDLVIKGTRIYGGLWVFDPTSKHDDGLFEVIPFLGKRDWTSKALVHLDQTGMLSESLENMGIEHSTSLRGARIDLELLPHPGMQIFAQIDGEEFPTSARIQITVHPRVIRLVIP
ncbi:MAG: diacylglycerol/lipid kinase family protein [Polyangiales bacterium]